jgi:hypothetical protein
MNARIRLAFIFVDVAVYACPARLAIARVTVDIVPALAVQARTRLAFVDI